MSDSRSSQVVAEIQVHDVSFVNVSQLPVEAIVGDISFINVSQAALEVHVHDASPVLVSQLPAEILAKDASPVLVSQLVVEVLVLTHEVTVPLTYPTLIGLGYSVFKRPIFKNSIGEGASQRESRISYSQNNVWEWDLTYEYLPDKLANGTTNSDLKTMMGFFLASHGGLIGFQFLDPDDNAVTNQGLAVTDGVTSTWTLCRNFGQGVVDAGIAVEEPFEPVGVINFSGATPFAVYFDGVLQSGTTYDVVTTTPYNQLLRFHATPTTGITITIDMSYFFYCRFKDDMYDFEKFVNQIWLTKKITLRSLKGP